MSGTAFAVEVLGDWENSLGLDAAEWKLKRAGLLATDDEL
jgi:hypothetical protein